MKKVVLFGTSDTAELAHYYLDKDSNFCVEAYTLTKDFLVAEQHTPRHKCQEYPVVSFDKLTSLYPPKEFLLFAPMTGRNMNRLRKSIYDEGLKLGYTFASYVSSKASIHDNAIGNNCFILEDNTIQPFTEIGNNVVLWSGNHIGHHGKIEDHVFFTSHVVMSGHCHIKQRAWLGVNSTLRDGITIGEGSLIAMGSLVTKSTENNSFYMGSPAKIQLSSADDVMT